MSTTRIEFAPAVADAIDHIIDHLQQHDARDASARVQETIRAIDVLADNPRIGRPLDDSPGMHGKRELVIGRHAHGYLALYVHVEAIDTVFVLALRSQGEAGCDLR